MVSRERENVYRALIGCLVVALLLVTYVKVL